MASTIGRPAAALRRESTAQRRSPAGDTPAGWSAGRACASPPRGRLLVAAPAVTLHSAYRSGSRPATPSRSNRLLPMPAAPPRMRPRPVALLAASVRRDNSAARPTNLHGATAGAYRHCRDSVLLYVYELE